MTKRRYSNLFGGGVASNSLVTRLSTILRSVKNNEFCHLEQSRHLERGREDGRSGVCLFNVRLRERSHIKAAFTLPEILITIGIIGIVAAMTVPNLVYKYKKSCDLNRLKKVYAELAQAFRLASQNVDLYSAGNGWTNTSEVINTIKPYINWSAEFVNNEYSAAKAMCYSPNRKRNLMSKKASSYAWYSGCGISNPIGDATASIELSTGACIGFVPYSRRTLIVDTNGAYEGPNRMGRDVFVYVIEKDGSFVPEGLNQKYNTIVNNSSHGCRKDIVSCGSGYYCAARIWRDGWQINYY